MKLKPNPNLWNSSLSSAHFPSQSWSPEWCFTTSAQPPDFPSKGMQEAGGCGAGAAWLFWQASTKAEPLHPPRWLRCQAGLGGATLWSP